MIFSSEYHGLMVVDTLPEIWMNKWMDKWKNVYTGGGMEHIDR